MEKDSKNKKFKVLKRDGKKVLFNEDKIGLAIKKAFDSISETPYDASD